MNYTIINNNITYVLSSNSHIETSITESKYTFDYEISKSIHLSVSISALVIGIILIALFWFNRNHYLIRYRGFKSAYIVGCASLLNIIIVPVCTKIKKIYYK